MLYIKTRSIFLLLTLLLSQGSGLSREIDHSYAAWLHDMDIDIMDNLPAEPTYHDFLVVLASNNPELRSLFYQWQASTEKISAINAWPNPQLKAGVALQPVVTAQGPQDLRIGLSQVIPRRKELRSSTQEQEHYSQAALAKLHSHLNGLSLELKQVYAEYYLLSQELNIQKQILLLLNNWQEVLLTRYRSARASHPDLVKTQLELLRREDQIQTTEVSLENTKDELRRLLDLEASYPLKHPSRLDQEHISQLSQSGDEAVENPALMVQRSILNAAQSTEQVAKSRTRPQLILGLDWIVTGTSDLVNPALNAGGDAVALNVGFSIPVWRGKNRGHLASAHANLLAQEAKYEAITREIEFAIVQAKRNLNDAERRIELLENSLIPKSQEAYEVLETAYTAGNADLLALLDAVENLLDHKLQLVEANVALWKTQARLNYLRGIIS